MEQVINIEGINFRYDEKAVLEDISLTVRPGSFVSIIGPNGSGKTTLLKCLSGVLAPERGRIQLKGRDIHKYNKRELARFLAYVPQSSTVDFGFSVMDIVLMGRAPYMKPFQAESHDDLRIADEAMSMTNILMLKDKKITEISGGERQRVIIACALAQTPDIILLDEPVSNLDIQHQIEVMGILKRLSIEKRMTVIIVLHDLNLAAEYSDTIMLLKSGKLLCSGAPYEVITEENIEYAYETSIYMTKNPVSGNPHIIPVFKS